MLEHFINREKKIAIIGLGYVGLPIALAFAKKFSVIGFDINDSRVKLMQQNIDPSKELDTAAFENTDIQFTAEIDQLAEANFFIVAVPTPIDKSRTPNLKPLLSASETIGKVIKKGDCVVFESTVYPGCTEEDCLPIIDEISGLCAGKDYFYGYSPERINPGDKERTIEKIIKVVSGCCETSLNLIAELYGKIIEAGIYKASSVKVAEAAKVIENTQRDLNIALMNELSIIFDKMDIPTYEVLKAAGTKWNFLNFKPGLVGGHCIGVDPYYLTFKAQKLNYNPQVILSGRRINDDMSKHVATRLVQMMIKQGKSIQESKVLIMGLTFKENVSDIRNSKVADVFHSLSDFSVNVEAYDPWADPVEMKKEYDIPVLDEPLKGYDAVIVAVAHDEFKNLNGQYFDAICNPNAILVDLKNIYVDQYFPALKVWTL